MNAYRNMSQSVVHYYHVTRSQNHKYQHLDDLICALKKQKQKPNNNEKKPRRLQLSLRCNSFYYTASIAIKILNTTLRAAETPVGNFVIFGLEILLSTLSISICIRKQNSSE